MSGQVGALQAEEIEITPEMIDLVIRYFGRSVGVGWPPEDWEQERAHELLKELLPMMSAD